MEVSSEDVPNNPDSDESSDGSWLDSPLYWVAIIAAIAVTIGSLAIINRNLRERVNAGLEIEEE